MEAPDTASTAYTCHADNQRHWTKRSTSTKLNRNSDSLVVAKCSVFSSMGDACGARKSDFVVSEQQRRRPDCASTQSDQRLCSSLSEKYYDSASYAENFNILASICSCVDQFESCLVRNPRRQVFSWVGYYGAKYELWTWTECKYWHFGLTRPNIDCGRTKLSSRFIWGLGYKVYNTNSCGHISGSLPSLYKHPTFLLMTFFVRVSGQVTEYLGIKTIVNTIGDEFIYI